MASLALYERSYMRKVILCVIALLAILFGAVLGVLYPPRILLVNAKNDASIPFAPQNQTALPTSIPILDDTEVDALPSTTRFEVNGYNSPLPYKSPVASSGSNKDLKETSSSILGKLSVDNQRVTIYSGIDEETLKNGPGWMPESALPGNDGMSVILGHRNRNHLKIIENVQVGYCPNQMEIC